jgi:anti-anti-sigma regulatory factor
MSLRPTMPDRPRELRAALQGRLTHAVVSDLRGVLTGLASKRPRRLVLDLSEATAIDAAVIVILRALERRVTAAGGLLVVIAHGPVARTITAIGAGDLLASGPADTARPET